MLCLIPHSHLVPWCEWVIKHNIRGSCVFSLDTGILDCTLFGVWCVHKTNTFVHSRVPEQLRLSVSVNSLFLKHMRLFSFCYFIYDCNMFFFVYVCDLYYYSYLFIYFRFEKTTQPRAASDCLWLPLAASALPHSMWGLRDTCIHCGSTPRVSSPNELTSPKTFSFSSLVWIMNSNWHYTILAVWS